MVPVPAFLLALAAPELDMGLGGRARRIRRQDMCWMCDNPGSDPQDYLDYLKNLISEHGWAIQGVEPDGLSPAWSYTVGLTPLGYTELAITGLDGIYAASELNDAATLLTGTGLPAPGDPFMLPSGRVAELVIMPNPWAHMYLAAALYGEQGFRALQLAYRDDRRRWPWDEGYSGPYQPVLGDRVTAL